MQTGLDFQTVQRYTSVAAMMATVVTKMRTATKIVLVMRDGKDEGDDQ